MESSATSGDVKGWLGHLRLRRSFRDRQNVIELCLDLRNTLKLHFEISQRVLKLIAQFHNFLMLLRREMSYWASLSAWSRRSGRPGKST